MYEIVFLNHYNFNSFMIIIMLLKYSQIYVNESLLLYDPIAKKCCNKYVTTNEEISYEGR